MPTKKSPQKQTKRKAGRPSKAIPRESLLKMAASVFAKNGYAAASLNNIAMMAGIRKPSLIHRFGNKETLYLESLSMVMTKLNGLVLHAAQSGGEPIERLDKLSSDIVDCFGESPETAQLICREIMDEGPFYKGVGSDLFVHTLQAGILFLEAGKVQGAFHFDDAANVVMSVVGVHLNYFALPNISSKIVNANVFDQAAIDRRRKVVVEQVRRLCGVKKEI